MPEVMVNGRMSLGAYITLQTITEEEPPFYGTALDLITPAHIAVLPDKPCVLLIIRVF